MNIQEYQDLTQETAYTYHEAIKKYLANPNPKMLEIFYCALGLSGEVGEVVDKIKKLLRDGIGSPDEEFIYLIKNELGDVLWYIAQLADRFGLSLNEIANDNILKLRDRRRRGVLGGSGDLR